MNVTVEYHSSRPRNYIKVNNKCCQTCNEKTQMVSDTKDIILL